MRRDDSAQRALMKEMRTSKISPRPPALASMYVALGMLAAPHAARAAELHPETVKAFEQHVSARSWQASVVEQGAPFLWTAASAGQRRLLQGGGIVVNPLQGKGDIAVEKGLVHHWIGGVFVPGRTAAGALAVLRDFDSYEQVYSASVEDSKTLQRDGDVYRTFLRLRKHRVVTVVLNTEYQVEFTQEDATRWSSRSESTRIAQVKDAGDPGEQELPAGQDSGYLWGIVTFWRVEEGDGGVYLECEVIGLTRGVPYGLGWLVRPIIRSFPRESLFETLNDTRNALLGKGRDAKPQQVLSRAALPIDAEAPPALSTIGQ